MYLSAEFALHSRIWCNLLKRNIPFPCDLDIGFMIHIAFCVFLNSELKRKYSPGRRKDVGRNPKLRRNKRKRKRKETLVVSLHAFAVHVHIFSHFLQNYLFVLA
jgi:hypothetical protein